MARVFGLVEVRGRHLLLFKSLQVYEALEVRLLDGGEFDQLLDSLDLLLCLDLLIRFQLHQDAAARSLDILQLVRILPDLDQREHD